MNQTLRYSCPKKKSWDTPARNRSDLEINIFLFKYKNLVKDNETKRNLDNYNFTYGLSRTDTKHSDTDFQKLNSPLSNTFALESLSPLLVEN